MLRLLVFTFLSSIIITGHVFALCGLENVLVVQNGSSPISCRIAAHYIVQRSIPADNLVTVNTQDSSISSANESITWQDYIDKIENPIKAFLTQHNLTDQIQYIVLTKGIPIRISNGRSVDSTLAAIDLVNPILIELTDDNGNIIDTVHLNRYWRATEPFTHASYGGYLVTRLDGYTEADAKALVDRAIAQTAAAQHILLDIDVNRGLGGPSFQPKSILLPDETINTSYYLDYCDYNADMTRASQVITGRQNLSVQLESTSMFAGSPEPLTGYISWGSNDYHFNLNTYHSLAFAPRGIAETAVSTSGRTFLPTTGGQSLIADLIAQGAAGAKGYVTEPYLDAIASPTVLMDFYTSGRNLAESFYAASRFIGWKDIVLGDPLCCLTGTTVDTIAQAKALPDGTLVSISGKVVSAGTVDFGDKFYIQEADRSSGIQVNLGKLFPWIDDGIIVSVRGILTTKDGERIITNASVVAPVIVPSATQKAAANPPRIVKLRAKRLR